LFIPCGRLSWLPVSIYSTLNTHYRITSLLTTRSFHKINNFMTCPKITKIFNQEYTIQSTNIKLICKRCSISLLSFVSTAFYRNSLKTNQSLFARHFQKKYPVTHLVNMVINYGNSVCCAWRYTPHQSDWVTIIKFQYIFNNAINRTICSN